MIVNNLAAYSNPAVEENASTPPRTPSISTPNADYNTFLKLLIAQMKNQDPTQPSDPTKYISQLASFSAVEQSTQTNKKLDNLNKQLASLYVNSLTAQASSYIGKHIISKTDKGAIIEGNIKSIKIYSDGLVATLNTGEKVLISPGATISDPQNKQETSSPNTHHGEVEKKGGADSTHKLVG